MDLLKGIDRFRTIILHTISSLPPHFVRIFRLVELGISKCEQSPDNQPKITEAIRKVLKEDYNYDSTVSNLTDSQIAILVQRLAEGATHRWAPVFF